MKTRHGFVSNSSTTSFCIYGVNLDNLLDDERVEAIQRRLYSTKLPLDTFSYCEMVFLGRSLTEINDEQTFGDFKAKVELQIEKLVGEKLDCGIYERAEANY